MEPWCRKPDMKHPKPSFAGPARPKGPERPPRQFALAMMLAASVAWACVAVFWAVRTWPQNVPTMRMLVVIWAGLPGWTWAGWFARLGSYAAALGLVLGSLGLALGTGGVLARLAAPRGKSASLALTLALGFAGLSLAVTGSGFAGLMSRLPLAVLAAGALVLGLRELGARRAVLAGAWNGFREEPASTALALGGAVVLWIVFTALPDTHEDPLVYHWAAPEYFLRVGRLVGAPWHFQWHNPLGIEMLFGLGLALAGPAGIKAMDLGLVVTALLATGALARRFDPRARGWAAAVLLALSPAVAEQVWIAKSDLGLVTFWAAAFLAPLEWPLCRPGGAIAAGVLAGFCGAVKWTAVFPCAGLAAWLLLKRPGRRGIILIAAAALMAAAAWPVRNWLTAGNPVIPFLSRWFDVPWWGPDYEKAVHTYARVVTPSGAVQKAYWLLAWRDVFGEPNALGLALAALAPLGLAAFLPPAAAAACAVSMLVFLLLLAERNARFLLPVVALAAAAGEVAMLTLRGAWPRLARGLWIVLLAGSLLHLGAKVAGVVPPYGWCWAMGQMTTAALRQAESTVLDEARTWCAERLSPDARILLEGEQKRFGWKQPVVSAHVVVVPLPWRWAKAARAPDDLAKKWRQAGIRYVAHNLVSARFRHQIWFTGPAWGDRELRLYRAFALRYLTEVHRSPHLDYLNGFYYVMRVDVRPHPPRKTVPVLPWTESLFQLASAASKPATAALGRKYTLEALSRVPDVEDAVEMAAMNLHGIGDNQNALALNRALAGVGFDGEASWFNLADEESRAGYRRAAFAALREENRLAPSFRDKILELEAVLYYNWMIERARAGDLGGCCRLLDMCLRANPGFQAALSASDQLGCEHGKSVRPVGKFLFSK